jgi:YARHG domain-containing protein
MKRLYFTFAITLIILTTKLNANDGAYYLSGNHLIPIQETQVELRKEVLQIRRLNHDSVEIFVDYELYNPGKEKTILVGFEAEAARGAADGYPLNGKHRYLYNFMVNLNNVDLDYDVKIVPVYREDKKDFYDGNYYKNGKFFEFDEKKMLKMNPAINNQGFKHIYVYYFTAKFKPGINKLRHYYIYEMGRTAWLDKEIGYVLTAANRWANNQIDDFTMIIDMGKNEEFMIRDSTFEDTQWRYGHISSKYTLINYKDTTETRIFFTKKAPVVYHQKDFHPKGELYIFSVSDFYSLSNKFDYRTNILRYRGKVLAKKFRYREGKWDFEIADVTSYEILKEYPYSLKGKQFSDPVIQKYYDSLEWYQSDPNYDEAKVVLNDKEKRWLEQLDKIWEAQEKK